MSALASLASGDSCGPSNPMAQLSKLYSSDRGVQQDHFNPQAGPSQSNFRQQAGTPSQLNQSANAFFNPQQHQPHPAQPLDLAALVHSLPPSHAATPPPLAAPAWAQAFAKSELHHAHLPLPQQHNDTFQRTFSPPPAALGNAAWVADFGRQSGLPGSSKAMTVEPARAEVGMMAGGVGGVGRMGMMGLQRPMGGMGVSMGGQGLAPAAPVAMNQVRHLDPEQVTSTKQDWDTAFLAQESTTNDLTRSGYTPDQLTRPDSPIHRAESPRTAARARDQLAETAGALLSSVQRGEAQAQTTAGGKMAQSTFLELMRKLRDGEVEVQGDKVVEQIEPAGVGADVKGKGKGRAYDPEPFYQQPRTTDGASTPVFTSESLQAAHTGSAVEEFARAQHQFAVDQSMAAQAARDRAAAGYQPHDTTDLWADEDQARRTREEQSRPQAGRHVQFQGDGGVLHDSDGEMDVRTEEMMRMDTRVAGARSGWEEDFDAEMIAGGHARPQQKGPRELSAQQKEWEALQDDWDNFEATATGVQPVASTSTEYSSASIIGGYRFAAQNPYAQTTRTHAQHASASSVHPALSTYDSVLQTEAAVQQNPKSAPAWLALGIKQQENEREDLAILALQQSIALDPELGEAHLALAISYTNENQRGLAYECMERWVDGLEGVYPGVVEGFKERWGEVGEGLEGRHRALTEVLMELARRGGEEVDAEVQVGLGVLFNASDEYEKASDCFEAALAVRPEDPLLYNRLGATFANSGKTELAIQYYLEACALRPGYVRARFNLAVANMNLGHYQEAVAHLITALDIQEEEAKREESSGGAAVAATLTSQTLWDSLNTSLLMLQRSDLSPLTVQRDLASLKRAFGDELSF